MILTYWTMMQKQQLLEDLERYRIPQDVKKLSISTLGILDDRYGMERNLEDDGGCVIILLPDSETDIEAAYHTILERHKTTRECAEFEDVVCASEGTVWKSDLYIVGNDYGVTLVYPADKEVV